jgi:hypothetical protein
MCATINTWPVVASWATAVTSPSGPENAGVADDISLMIGFHSSRDRTAAENVSIPPA